jgi:anti-anti-sigma factor
MRPPRFQCRAATDGSQGRVVVCGELDLATAPQLDCEFERLKPYPERVLLDLGAVEFIDSAGAHLLVEFDRRVQRAGGQLIVALDFGGDVEWFLAVSGADRELTLTGCFELDCPPRPGGASAARSTLRPRRDGAAWRRTG